MATANAPAAPRRPTTVATPSGLEVTITRVFDAPRTRLWAMWTDPAHVPHWMLGPDGWTMPVCEIDLRPGGSWRFAWRRADGTGMEMSGEFLEVEPPLRLVQTERWGGDWPETTNTLLLDEADGRTTMTHTMLFPSREARDAALGTGMNDGTTVSFDRLDDYLLTLG
ncbi:MAG TPA: SRPBCC family protein [Longimicrobiaceae bacterium]|jgi:uncharacterized protein YndB with AHSA1/START domain